MAKSNAVSKFKLISGITLLIILLASALAVIYSKNLSRAIFIEIEHHERALDQYEVEWGQMQLELSTLAEQNRVEIIAKDRLKLIVPPHENIIYLKP